jgi:AraC-like DNA-binding protein
VVLAPAGTRHRIGFPEPGVLSGLHIQFTILGGLDVLSFYEVPTLVGGARARRMGAIQSSLVKAHERSAALSFRNMAARMELSFGLLGEILAASRLRRDASNRLGALDRVRPALEHIQRHLNENVTRDELARCANLSPARFNTVFRETMGLPPMAYVRKLRMQKAMQLLRRGGLNVSQAAHALGYCDPFHFSRQFKMAAGMSPSAWRERLRKTFREIVP